jgi:UDP-hydrolysing UDP-N-acetyl-D-glucosamine 2-epimerase
MTKRKIAIVIGSRANYASIKSVISELDKNANVELQLFVGASAILDKYGNVSKLIEKDGFKITEKFYMLVEGETPETMSMSTGIGIIKLSGILMNHKPDIVITIGDRFETMSTAIATTYMNIHLAHTMGGEITGTIDESIRHAVTKFSHIHFPANALAAERIKKLGENPEHIFLTGCPRIDVVNEIITDNRNNNFDEDGFWKEYKGVGETFPLQDNGFLLVLQHPVTTEYKENRKEMRRTLEALNELKMPTVMLWPNADAGSDEISKEIRTFRENNNPKWLHIFKNLPMNYFIRLMDCCSCMIGNSSSAIREGPIVGVPVVNVGTRQQGRARGNNVIDVPHNKTDILDAIKKQLEHGKYSPNKLYGDGSAGKKISDVLSTIDLSKVSIQKRLVLPGERHETKL